MSNIRKKSNKSILEFGINIGRVNLTQKAVFAKHMAIMLESGITINEALNIAIESSEIKFAKVLRKVLLSVESGSPFSESLGEHPKVFSGFFVNAIYAAEEAGTLPGSFRELASYMEKEKDLISKIKRAMVYPVLVLVSTVILAVVISFAVLPKIVPLFEGLKIDLPLSTRILIAFSNHTEVYGAVTFGWFIGSIMLISWLLKRKFIKPISHGLLLNIPIVKKLVRDTSLSRFCRTLGTLLKSGVSIDDAIFITGNTTVNYHYQSALKEISQGVSGGARLSENLVKYDHFFPVLVRRMIAVGEESGKLEEVFFYLANFYEAEVDNSSKSLSTIIEPVLLGLIGLAVGFLAMAIITPMYKITGGLNL